MAGQSRSALGLFSEIELLQLILHHLGEGVVVADREGQFLLWNQQAERIMGKGMTQTPMTQWAGEFGLFEPDSKTPFAAERIPLARALRGESCDEVELFVRNPRIPEGAYIKVTGRPIRDLSGQLLGGVVVFRDTTAERKAQESLTRLASIVTSSADGILALAPDGRIAECNRSAAVMLARAESELRGLKVSELAVSELRPDFELLLEEAARGKPSVSHVLEFERKGKGRFHGSVTLAPIISGGRAVGISMIVRDISERKRLEAMRDDLIAVAGHELRGPAMAVQMSLEVLFEELAEAHAPAEALKALDSAQRNCGRLIHMLSECLDAQRLRAGESAPLKLEPCDLVALAREAIKLNWPFALRLGVLLSEEGLYGEARVSADRQKLLQALANLITNAAKFSKAGDTVMVGLERRPSAFRVFVADQGPGVPEDFKDRIFQRFARARTAQSAKTEGAGLGLSIAKDIVERLGGRIGFDSAPGRGAKFYIDLPEAG